MVVQGNNVTHHSHTPQSPRHKMNLTHLCLPQSELGPSEAPGDPSGWQAEVYWLGMKGTQSS